MVASARPHHQPLLPVRPLYTLGADSMIAVGIPVLAGMVFASVFGIFLIPMLYVVFQRLREGRKQAEHDKEAT